MENLFYSETDEKLFWIPSYYTHGTGILRVLIKNLKESEAELRKYVLEGEIYCDEIRKSRRYKSMWYFSIACPKALQPKEAFKLGPDWTMFSWIEN